MAEALRDEHDPLRRDAARLELDDLALIELAGDDRLEWLQGQATNDVRDLTDGSRCSFCLCEPTGGIVAAIDAWALEGRIAMAVARERVEAVLDRVERMTILEDVAATLSPRRGISIQGPAARGLALPGGDGTWAFPSDRTPSGGWDVWSESDAALDALRWAFPALDPDAAEAARIEAGVPRWGVDFGPRTLPPELGPAFEARHVSYAKGCYTGQEILMRMHARGHTNKTWVGLAAERSMAVGEAVLLGGREVGRVSSSSPARGEAGYVAAATLRNEATDEGTRVTVGEAEAEVRRMPLLRTA